MRRLRAGVSMVFVALLAVGCATAPVGEREPAVKSAAEPSAEVTPAALRERFLSGLPLGSDVYHIMIYMNAERDAGRFDDFRLHEPTEVMHAWKATEPDGRGVLYRLQIKDFLATELTVETGVPLPRAFDFYNP